MTRPAMYRTLPTLMVLSTLLAEPTGEMYGLQIMDRTGLGSGTVYAVLGRLDTAGVIVRRDEDIDPRAEGRRPRRLCRLTDAGRVQAQAAATLILGVLTPGETP